MKKLLTAFAAIALMATVATAGNYTLNDDAVEDMFAAAQNVTMDLTDDNSVAFTNVLNINNVNEEQDLKGYLIRAYFCGSFAAHRGYMGNGGKKLWMYYLCIPVYGGILSCVDFWRVVFDRTRMEEYRDNSAIRVWGQK